MTNDCSLSGHEFTRLDDSLYSNSTSRRTSAPKSRKRSRIDKKNDRWSITGPSEWLGVTVSRGEPMIGRFGTPIIQVFIITVIFAGSSSNFLIQTVCNCFFLLFGFNTIIQCVNVIIIHPLAVGHFLAMNTQRSERERPRGGGYDCPGLCCHDPSCWLAKKHNHWPRGPQLE